MDGRWGYGDFLYFWSWHDCASGELGLIYINSNNVKKSSIMSASGRFDVDGKFGVLSEGLTVLEGK